MRRLQQRIEPGLPTKPLPHGSRIICTGKTYKEDNTEMKPGLPAPLLFVLVVVSWGFSWYAIKLQLGDVDPSVSVFWRFFLAALFLGAGLLVSRRLQWVHLNLHPRLAFMGMTLFSMNFLVFYHATEHIASGVVSVIFAGAALFIALFEFLLFHKPPSARIVIGGMAGMIGLGILFSGSIAGNQVLQPQGLTLAVIGTCLFSIGNIVSSRLPEGVHFPSAVATAMVYGALCSAGIALAGGKDFSLPASAVYFSGLLYLSLIASVVGFLAYLTLVKQDGPSRVGYITVLFPLIALSVSATTGEYVWSLLSAVGIGFVFFGTAIVFAR